VGGPSLDSRFARVLDEIAELDDVSFADFVSRYSVPQSVVSYFGMWANIVFVVPIDLLAASEAIRTFKDFTAGGAGRYHSGGYGCGIHQAADSGVNVTDLVCREHRTMTRGS
jgi:hypothetical protein